MERLTTNPRLENSRFWTILDFYTFLGLLVMQWTAPTRRHLVHRHRRMIHPIRLQEFENICKILVFVNVPNESVH